MTATEQYADLVARQLREANKRIMELEAGVRELLEYVDSDSALDMRADDGVHIYWTKPVENLRKLVRVYDK